MSHYFRWYLLILVELLTITVLAFFHNTLLYFLHIYILIITWSWSFGSLIFSYIWRGHSGHDHMVAIYILYMYYYLNGMWYIIPRVLKNGDLNGMWYIIPYLFYDVTGRINPRMDYAFFLLHIEEFWKMAIPIIWCYRQLQSPNSTLRYTIFSIH